MTLNSEVVVLFLFVLPCLMESETAGRCGTGHAGRKGQVAHSLSRADNQGSAMPRRCRQLLSLSEAWKWIVWLVGKLIGNPLKLNME